MKTAALSFEHFLGFLTSSGVDVGNIGHSRLQFPDIMKAAYIYLIQKMKQYMVKPLPSTGMPPHFSVAVDKSTPHRETNHAVMVIVPVNGIRVALPLDAEVVYKISDVGTTALAGGTGSELADQVFKSLNKIGIKVEDLGRLRTVHADGQYQASTFQQLIRCKTQEERSQTEKDKYSLLPWDPSHWLDIVMEQARETNVETSKFFKRLVNDLIKCTRCSGMDNDLIKCTRCSGMDNDLIKCTRCSGVDNDLIKCTRCSGMDEVTLNIKVLPRLLDLNTVTFSTTRFFSSAYESWDRIFTSYESLITAYSQFRETHDEEEETKYEVRGEGFVIDLCCALDVLFPIVSLMVNPHTVNLPV